MSSRSVRGVVELFTSQGCSSCPSAERILSNLSEDPGIVALAYHVDYWDYIGWTDPHGSKANTERQRAYAKAFKTGTIYTPQAVVNGQRDVVGSRAEQIRQAVTETSLAGSSGGAEVSLALKGQRLKIRADFGRAGTASNTPVLMLVTYDEKSETAIDKGENKGLTLVNSHAVRDWRVLGMSDGKPLEVDIPLDTLRPDGARKGGCAAILQTVTETGAPGPILAAVTLEF